METPLRIALDAAREALTVLSAELTQKRSDMCQASDRGS